ncbi:MAG TPA: glycosyltransferase family 9 protein [Bdellovibrionales bacterium]|nr:glycosyltransferase family 9 protein [Bdellovibrionales bacterium]
MEIFRDVPQVLWIRVGALGDLLISTAALEETFKRFPHSKVWVLGDRFWLELLEPAQWPRLNGIIIRKKNNRGQLYVPASQKGWRREGDARSLGYFYRRTQATVNLRIESYRFAWGPWRARVPIRIGSCPWPMKWLYTHWSPGLGKEPALHERDWYVNVVRAPKRSWFPLGRLEENRSKFATATDRPRGGLPRLKEADPSTIARLTLPKAQSASTRAPLKEPVSFKNYWLINPTSSRIEKAWPAIKFREFALQLAERLRETGQKVVVIGAPNETEWLKKVAGEELPIVQPPTLGELIDVVAGANILVTNTSSVQFIAASTKTPTITLMGRSSPVRWGPVGPQDIVVKGKIPEGGHPDLFVEERLAYESISVEQVLRECEKFVKVSNPETAVETNFKP